MGLILPQEVEVAISHNATYYSSKGYTIPTLTKADGSIKHDLKARVPVNVLDMPRGSNVEVYCICDYCGAHFMKRYIDVCRVLDSKNPKLSCGNKKCHGAKSGESLGGWMKEDFESWCLRNHREELLTRWDTEKNQCAPADISSMSHEKFWFRCPRGLHESEEFLITTITGRRSQRSRLSGGCRKCNSIAQHLLDTYGENALDAYWDYQKNDSDPWMVPAASRQIIWINCQNTDYHGSYAMHAYDVKINLGCPYCRHSRIHPRDSFAQSLINLYGESALDMLWDYQKNTVDPWTIPPSGTASVWLKCYENPEHPSYEITTNRFSNRFQRCPLCSSSVGERRVAAYLQKHHIHYISEYRDENCRDQQPLPFDFYIPDLQMMIEYQGIQHYQPVDFSGCNSYDIDEAFRQQQRRDAIKESFCKANGYTLVTIPYTKIDQIPKYLNEIFSKIRMEVAV